MSTYANVPSHTHKITHCSLLLFQLLAFPSRPQLKLNPPRWKHPVAPLCTQGFRVEGIWRPLSATRWRLLLGPVCPAAGGGFLSHEYLVTQTKLSMNSWQGIWTPPVTQTSHTPNGLPTPPLEKPPVEKVAADVRRFFDVKSL